MGFKNEYGYAALEVLDILNNMQEDDVKRIPQSFMDFLIDTAPLDSSVKFDHSRPIDELNISFKAQELLGVIYINWWCDSEEKKNLRQRVIEYEMKKEEELRKKYSYENLFNRTKLNNEKNIDSDLSPKDRKVEKKISIKKFVSQMFL